MTLKERASCILTIKELRELALNVHGVIDVIDDENCKKLISLLDTGMSDQPKMINWQYCKNLNDINRAIKERDENWEGLKSAEQIINITWDSHQGCYVVFWKESDGE